jgi:hypothetical protein
MSLFQFEARRLLRQRVFLLTFVAIVGLGVVQTALDSAEPGAMIFLAPLVAAWVAAGDTAANARLGRLDLVCSRGPSFAALAGVRFALGILAGTGVVLAATLLPAWAGEDPHLVLEWLGVVVYWAAVASWLGQWVSGAGMVLLPIATTVLSSWWVMAGAMRVLGVPAAQDPAVYVTVPLVRLGSTVPADLMEPMLILPAGVSWVVWPLAAAALAGGLAAAQRRQFLVREEG